MQMDKNDYRYSLFFSFSFGVYFSRLVRTNRSLAVWFYSFLSCTFLIKMRSTFLLTLKRCRSFCSCALTLSLSAIIQRKIEVCDRRRNECKWLIKIVQLTICFGHTNKCIGLDTRICVSSLPMDSI